MKYCPRCQRVFEDKIVYCPDDNSILHPREDPPIQTRVDEKVLLDDWSMDRFSRRLCPKCDAWKNWKKSGKEYTCLSCGENFVLEDGNLFGSPGKSHFEKQRELIESSPVFSVLDAIDSKSAYWIEQFKSYESTGKKSWNWPTFFFGAQWYFWKGMWQKGLLISCFYAGMYLLFLLMMKSATALNDIVGAFIILILFWGYEVYLARLGGVHYYQYLKNQNGNLKKARVNKVVGRIIFVLLMLFNPLSNCHVKFIYNQGEIIRQSVKSCPASVHIRV